MARAPMGPTEAVDWLFRHAARVTHPDHGGTHEDFQTTEQARHILRTALAAAGASPRGQAEAETAAGGEPGPEPADLVAFLRDHGLEVIDKRAAGGRLWVLGGEERRPLMAELAGQGLRFVFAAAGGRATGHRAAWWLAG